MDTKKVVILGGGTWNAFRGIVTRKENSASHRSYVAKIKFPVQCKIFSNLWSTCTYFTERKSAWPGVYTLTCLFSFPKKSVS